MAPWRRAGTIPHRWRIALHGGLCVAVGGLLVVTDRIGSANSLELPASVLGAPPARVVAQPTGTFLAGLDVPADSRLAEHVLRSGETLGRVFGDLGLTAASAEVATTALARYVDLRRVAAGARYAAVTDGARQLTGFRLEVAGRGAATIVRQGDGWSSSWRAVDRRVQTRSVRGALVGSLEDSIERAGAPGDLAYAMAEVLQWDLDFNRDLRLGDAFQVLFEEVTLDGEPAGLGHVLAARYSNRGRTLAAFRFTDGAYYDGEGRPLQKMFLRSPIPYSRVTSRFSAHRFHPILNTVLPHYGVDYGAPEGTPARVTADGVVTFVGWDGGGGRTVKVRHPNDYLTCYLHLSRFPAGLAAGSRVTQGEVIGFVGSTGLATGPHLDYRIQHHGGWIDPLRLESVPADPVPAAQLGRFREWRDAMVASLDRGEDFRAPGETRLAGLAAARPDATHSRAARR